MTTMAPSDVAASLVAAQNLRQLDAFVELFAPDAEIADHPTGSVRARGRGEIRELYRAAFASFDLRCTVLRRIVFGSFVIDHMEVTGVTGPDPVPGVAIYLVAGGMVTRMWSLDARASAGDRAEHPLAEPG